MVPLQHLAGADGMGQPVKSPLRFMPRLQALASRPAGPD
jgi:hypothetical protein